jgi:hypothetical protein
MARQENPPFGRGETFGGQSPAVPVAVTDGLQYEGAEWYFNDLNYAPGTVGAKPTRTERLVRCRIVRNVSGGNLLPKRLGSLQITGADGRYAVGRVDSYVNVLNGRGFPIDEFLPAAGVVNNDLFWIVIEGPAVCRTSLAALSASILVGDPIGAATGATSLSTTAGRVDELTFGAGTGAAEFNAVANFIGHALSAVTTAQTDTDLLVDVGKF